MTYKFLALFFRCGENFFFQIFAKNTNIHLHSSSLFHENEAADMIFSIIIRKKYFYGAFKIIFSPETFSMSLRHTGDNLERRFRRHLGSRGLKNIFLKICKLNHHDVLDI